MAEEKNEIIKEANEEVEEILSDEQMKAWKDYLFTAELEENSRNYRAEVKGREEGRKEGIKESKIEIAKKLKSKNIPIETIIEITELTEAEINNIQS